MQHIFELDPYRVLTDIGLPMTQHNGWFTTHDPITEGCTLAIDEHVVLQYGARSEFIAGRSLDFLAYYLGNYQAAVGHMIHFYNDLLQSKSALSLESIREQAALDASDSRDKFQRIRNLQQGVFRNPLLLQSKLWFSRHGFSPERCSRMLYAALGSEIIAITPTGKVDPNKAYIVAPYFADPATYAQLNVIDPKTEEMILLPLLETSHMFFGLHTLPGAEDDVRLYDDIATAASMCTFHRDGCSTNAACLHAVANASLEMNPYRLRKLVKMVGSNTINNQVISARQFTRELLIADSDATEIRLNPRPVTISDLDYLYVQFDRLAKEEKMLSPKLISLLEDMKADQELFSKFTDLVKDSEHSRFVTEFRNCFGVTKEYLHTGVRTSEDPTGYVARKGQQSLHISNFTFRVDHNVVFETDSDVYHSGRLMFHGKEYPMMLRRPSIAEIVTSLEQAALRAVKDSDPAEGVPTVVDRSYRGVLFHIISSQASEAPKQLGIADLGWSLKRDKFTLPSGHVNIFGRDPSSGPLHPFRAYMERHYSTVAVPSSPRLPVPYSFAPCLALITGMLLRLYHNHSVQPAMVRHTEANSNMLQAAFRALGQTSVIELHPNVRFGKRVKFPGLDCYPKYVYSPDDDVYESIKGTTICLREIGATLTEAITEEECRQLTSISSYVVLRTIELLLKTNVSKHTALDFRKSACSRYMTDGLPILQSILPELKSLSTMFGGTSGEVIFTSEG